MVNKIKQILIDASYPNILDLWSHKIVIIDIITIEDGNIKP